MLKLFNVEQVAGGYGGVTQGRRWLFAASQHEQKTGCNKPDQGCPVAGWAADNYRLEIHSITSMLN